MAGDERALVDDDTVRGRGRSFAALLTGAVVLGAFVRALYITTDTRWLIGGDGLAYHLEAHRIAAGLGYTSGFGDVGAQTAQHPPVWVTVLAAADWIGIDSQHAQEWVGAAIGLGIVVVAGLVGRRYVSPAVGVIAALIAAVYPGFWLLGTDLLSEPITILLVGTLTLLVADLRERPTLARTLVIGGLCGLVGLARSEQLALLVVVVVPVLLLARTVHLRRRIWLAGAAIGACLVVLAPWTIYNATRFEDPVLLSTDGGSALLIGNCPGAYHGRLLGYNDGACIFELPRKPGMDRSQVDTLARRTALENISGNLDRLPVVVPARVGRALAVFRPSQTVGFVARWMTTDSTPIWAWVASYWVILPLAIVGFVRAYRARVFLLPLVGPLLVATVVVLTTSGEPRFHSASDLGVIVLAAAGVQQLFSTVVRGQKSAPRPGSTPAAGSRTAATAAQRSVALVGPMNARLTTPSPSAITTIGTPVTP